MPTDNKTVTTEKPKAKRQRMVSGKFYAAAVEKKGRHITIKLPSKVAKYMNITGNEMFWTPVNGVIQLSGEQPQMVIPVLTGSGDFLPHQ